MTTTSELRQPHRRLVPAIVIVVGLLLISAIMIQQVAAQNSSGLKPPFKLHQPADLRAPLSGVPPLPLNAPIVMSQTFDSSFVLGTRYNFNVGNTAAPWHLVNANGVADTTHTWGPLTSAPLTYTLWNAGTWPSGGTPIAAGQPYTKNMQAYAIYNAINMTDYTTAFISVTYTMDTLDGDLFGVAYSTNGTDFTWLATTSGRDPALSSRRTDYYPIPKDLLKQKSVWIALIFTSQNRDNIDALGVYVNDIVMRAQLASKIYLPVLRHDPTATPTNTPTPTLTPTPSTVYRYNYTFGSGASNDPQFAQWGGYKTTGCGTSCSYQQNISGAGNPSGAMTLHLDGVNASGGMGPINASPTAVTGISYEYSADLLLTNGQVDARYGLIFNASSSTFSTNPPFLPDRNYYRLELHLSKTDRTKVVSYQLHQCTNGVCAAITNEYNLPSSIPTGQWHTVKIRQQGTNITFYYNGSPLVTASYDSAWGNDRRKFGVYLEAKSTNNVGGPLGIRVDNVRVLDLP
jgi:hypothetical protein